MRESFYLYFICGMLVFSALLSCVDKTLEIPRHPFYQQVPVDFGMSLEDCRNVFPVLRLGKPGAFKYPHFKIEWDSTNSVLVDGNLVLLGTYLLGIDNGILRKIIFKGVDTKGFAGDSKMSLRSNDEYFNRIIDLSCKHFINCNDFKIRRTLDEWKWESLSTAEYNIDFVWEGNYHFIYSVEIKEGLFKK